MDKKAQQCKNCSSKNLKAITGLTIGNPVKEKYTVWILAECNYCHHTSSFRTEKRGLYLTETTYDA